jgi:hypothetical protein
MDKKDYQLVLTALADHGTLGARINKLNKVWASTEDATLKALLGDRIKKIKVAWAQLERQSSTFVGDLNSAANKALVDYCEGCVSSSKPQWQILAERAGWRPPQ